MREESTKLATKLATKWEQIRLSKCHSSLVGPHPKRVRDVQRTVGRCSAPSCVAERRDKQGENPLCHCFSFVFFACFVVQLLFPDSLLLADPNRTRPLAVQGGGGESYSSGEMTLPLCRELYRELRRKEGHKHERRIAKACDKARDKVQET